MRSKSEEAVSRTSHLVNADRNERSVAAEKVRVQNTSVAAEEGRRGQVEHDEVGVESPVADVQVEEEKVIVVCLAHVASYHGRHSGDVTVERLAVVGRRHKKGLRDVHVV